MKFLIIFLIGLILGAINHEYDMKRNCDRYGDAKGWFVDITCNKEVDHD